LRLFIYLIIYILLIGFIPVVNVWLYALIEFTILPVLFLEYLISYLINNKYLEKAKKKIRDYDGKKLIITGSYGKTSTKVLANQILNLYYKSIATPKSFNTKLGIARFINDNYLDLYDYIVLEFGASKAGDIKALLDIAKPDIAIITEIGYIYEGKGKIIT
jgi:UDP-N-acetylmuramoyl-tripeptide--D-alanyl-D-alanine ligase